MHDFVATAGSSGVANQHLRIELRSNGLRQLNGGTARDDLAAVGGGNCQRMRSDSRPRNAMYALTPTIIAIHRAMSPPQPAKAPPSSLAGRTSIVAVVLAPSEA